MLSPWLTPSLKLLPSDEKNVPRDGRTAVLSPRQYYS